MRLIAVTAAVLLATSLVSTALADGCGDACDCPKAAPPKHSVTTLPMHPVAMTPVVHPAARPAVRKRVARNYYNYDAAAVVRDGRGHGEWRVAPNDGQVPGMIDVAQGGCCAAPAPMPGPCCAPMAYGPPPAYGPPVMYGPQTAYGPQPDAYAQVDDKGWTGGVGYNADGNGGGGGGGFMDGFGQVHFANSGGAQNGPSYNGYGESFQSNPSVPAQFQPRLMGGLAPSK